MKITLHPDYEHDSLYVAFSANAFERAAVARTVRVSESISADLGKDGELIGIDILSASKVVGNLSELSIDALVGVKEASELLDVKRPNFLRDFADRPDFPRPVAELATGRIWLKSQIEGYRKTHRRSRKKTRDSSPRVTDALSALLAHDELSLRHGALAYYRSALLQPSPHPPSIEDILAQSLEEDRRAFIKAQGDIENYIEAGYWIYLKYADALKSYLSRFLSTEQAEEIQRECFVYALRAMQQGEIDVYDKPFTRWLLGIAQALLPGSVITGALSIAPDASDPLATLVQAKRFQAALSDYEQTLARLQNEAFVLRYMSDWKVDEFAAALHSPEEALANARAQVEFRKRLADIDQLLRA